jgi:hypothetical protein
VKTLLSLVAKEGSGVTEEEAQLEDEELIDEDNEIQQGKV